MALSGDVDVSGCRNAGDPGQASASGWGLDRPALGVRLELSFEMGRFSHAGQKDRGVRGWDTHRA